MTNSTSSSDGPQRAPSPYRPGDATRVCTNCHRERPITEFSFRTNHGTGVFVPRPTCYDCDADYKRERNAGRRKDVNRMAREYRANNPEIMLRNAIRQSARNCGLDPDDIEAHYAAHSGLCDICGKPPIDRRLAIDHDHVTGEFRGLICRKCNAGIGFFDDKLDLLRAALTYFERDMSGLIQMRPASSRLKPKGSTRLRAVYPDIPCQGCGELMQRTGANQKWCDTCTKSRRRAKEAERLATSGVLF